MVFLKILSPPDHGSLDVSSKGNWTSSLLKTFDLLSKRLPVPSSKFLVGSLQYLTLCRILLRCFVRETKQAPHPVLFMLS